MPKRIKHRDWGRADDDADTFPAVTDEPMSDDEDVEDEHIDDEHTDDESPRSRESAAKREVPDWVNRFGQAVVERLPRISAAIAGGLLLCLSFPPFGWWYMAIVAFALLAWVLTREDTKLVGGFGYGFLFGAAFHIPLLPWTGVMVGMMPWLALSIAEAVFAALFGLLAVAARPFRSEDWRGRVSSSAWCLSSRRLSGPASAIPVRVPTTNPPSTSRPCRGTCRGSGWTSTPSGGRSSTTTSGRR